MQDNLNIVAYFGITAAIVLVLVLVILAFVMLYQRRVLQQELRVEQMSKEYQKELLNAFITTQEQERKRIAKDLHDDIGAMLATASLVLGQHLRKHPVGSGADNAVGNAHDLIQETIQSLRRISHDLLPPTLSQYGLQAALAEMLKNLKGSVALDIRCTETPRRLPVEMELGIFRVCQELIHNALKHAQASRITISVEITKEQVKLEYSDDGKGFQLAEVQRRSGGLGLKNIESRLSVFGAAVKWKAAENAGVQFSSVISLQVDNG